MIRSIRLTALSLFAFVHSAGMEATNGTIEHDFHNTLVPINGSHSGSSGRSTPNGGDPAPGKLFVGGLSWQTSSEKLREYFGMFGTVTDVLIMKDPVTQVGLYHLSITLGLLDHDSRLSSIQRTGLFARHSTRRLRDRRISSVSLPSLRDLNFSVSRFGLSSCPLRVGARARFRKMRYYFRGYLPR